MFAVVRYGTLQCQDLTDFDIIYSVSKSLKDTQVYYLNISKFLFLSAVFLSVHYRTHIMKVLIADNITVPSTGYLCLKNFFNDDEIVLGRIWICRAC
jgi:hypothetical protein